MGVNPSSGPEWLVIIGYSVLAPVLLWQLLRHGRKGRLAILIWYITTIFYAILSVGVFILPLAFLLIGIPMLILVVYGGIPIPYFLMPNLGSSFMGGIQISYGMDLLGIIGIICVILSCIALVKFKKDPRWVAIFFILSGLGFISAIVNAFTNCYGDCGTSTGTIFGAAQILFGIILVLSSFVIAKSSHLETPTIINQESKA
jgi:hypothetical protein